jgi:hypothetical protein
MKHAILPLAGKTVVPLTVRRPTPLPEPWQRLDHHETIKVVLDLFIELRF